MRPVSSELVKQQQRLDQQRVQLHVTTLMERAKSYFRGAEVLLSVTEGNSSPWQVLDKFFNVGLVELMAVRQQGSWRFSPTVSMVRAERMDRLAQGLSASVPLVWAVEFTGGQNLYFNAAWRSADNQIALMLRFPISNAYRKLQQQEIVFWQDAAAVGILSADGVLTPFCYADPCPPNLTSLPLTPVQSGLVEFKQQRFAQNRLEFAGNQQALAILTPIDEMLQPIVDEVDEGLANLLMLVLAWVIARMAISNYYTIRSMGYRDGLTGLYNRRALDQNLRELMALHDRGRIQYMGAIMLDIDHFKSFNDNYGHGVGDKALVALAKTLQQCCRRSDQLYRLGGEEFLIVVPGERPETLVRIAEKLRCEIKAIEQNFNLPKPVTVSVGVTARQYQEAAGALLARVDLMMYQAKCEGRDRVESG